MRDTVDIRKRLSYNATDNRDALLFINTVRQGIEYDLFKDISKNSPFSIDEWSRFLHISPRTIQRYKKEKGRFSALQTEKILEIILLYNKGVDIFGDSKKFTTWLKTENIALGGYKPLTLLDNSFGINMLSDELSRIEHGILA